MRSRWLILLLLGCTAVAQTKAPSQGPVPSTPKTLSPAQTNPMVPPEVATAQSASVVPESAPVLTLEGVCTANTTPCRTQISKAEFDTIVRITTAPGAPPIPPAMKRDRANQIAQMFAIAAAGEKVGVQNTPEGQEMMKLSRMQALANAYVRHLQQTSKPTDAEVEAYYNQNAEKYQQASVQQLFVPPLKSAAAGANTEEAEKARAEKFRQRAIAGEPFDKLQKEAIEGTNYQTPPPVQLTLQRETVQPARQFVFNLKDGEFSNVVTEPAGAVFYKMISKTTVPLAQARENISQRLTGEKFQSTMESMLKSVNPVLNDAYFAPSGPQAVPGPAPMAPPAVENSPAPVPAPASRK